jgi:hypothetical protein
MEATAQTLPTNAPRRWVLWTGRVLSALPPLLMVFSASLKLSHAPQLVQSWTTFGYSERWLTPIAVTELACVLLYLLPRTAVLGAVLTTGYLGGAVATHVRLSDPAFITPFLLGCVAWAGLYLRDPRLRELLPVRRPTSKPQA